MEKGKIIKGAFILTGANIITRLLGFFYRIYMADLIGAEGMGLYQLIVPVYMLIWSISSSGFSTAISKLTASEKAAGRNPHLILKLCIILSVSLGALLGFTVYLKADYIGAVILNDKRTILSLHLISFCFPFMAMGSCIRGYFFGMQDSLPPAISQVTEQITRMAVIFLVGGVLIPKGIDYACAAAVIGMCTGEIVSCVYIFICFMSQRKRLFYRKSRSIISAYAIILSMVIPLTLNRLASSLLSAIENILIPSRLILRGLSKTEAISEFGRLSGMAMPLLMFPSSFLTAISITIVPAISESCAVGKRAAISSTVEKSILFATITGFLTAGLFITLPRQISVLVYGDATIEGYLFLSGFICPFMYLNVMLTGILNGLGEQLSIFRNGIIGSIICLYFVWFIIPRCGIYGYICGSLIASATTAFLNMHKVNKRTGFKLSISNTVLKPLLCTVLSCLAAYSAENILNPLMPSYAATFTLIAAVCIVFAVLLILSGSVKKKDVEYLILPFKKM